jgi:hypothetical protein
VVRADAPLLRVSRGGYEVEIFSPAGGKCEADGMSDPRDASGYSASDLISMGFIHTPKPSPRSSRRRSPSPSSTSRASTRSSSRAGRRRCSAFDEATELHKKFVAVLRVGQGRAALCHGVALLRYAKLSNGEPLVKGKTVTGFANVEEDFADNAVWGMGALPRDKHLMPWRIEDELRRSSAPTSCRPACGAASRCATAT